MRSQSANLKAYQLSLFEAIELSPDLLDLLAAATTPKKKARFITAVLRVVPNAFLQNKTSEGLFQIFTAWIGQYQAELHDRFPRLGAAIKLRQDWLTSARSTKVQFIRAIGLNWDDIDRDAFLCRIRVVSLSKLRFPYPPRYHWMVESDEIDDKWREHIEKGRQPDKRRRRYPLFRVDPSQLQLDVSPDESVLVYDKDELVLAVIRNFCGHPGLLSCIDSIIKRAVDHQKNVRVSTLSKLQLILSLTSLSLKIQES